MKLNSKQKQAAEAPLQPLLIVAGAGTGKTRTLTSRLVHLIETGVPADTICALTFTNKAAREMKERAHRELTERGFSFPNGEKGPFIGTLHSFGVRILRDGAPYFGRSRDFTIFDDNDSLGVIKKILKEYKLPARVSPTSVAGKISKIKSRIVPIEHFGGSKNPEDKIIESVLEKYELSLREQNAFDFDDLIEKPARLFGEHPDQLAHHQQHYTHFLIDEYQDLNNTQYKLVRSLAGRSRGLSVVGDDQQTIYSWRGSNFELFLNFETDWPNAQVVVLDQNYRSSGNIIKAASGLIKHNLNQRKKELWTDNGEGEPVRIVEVSSENGEAFYIAGAIGQLVRAGAPPGQTAVLYRTNAQSRSIEQALMEERIPYAIYGGLQFYERREVRDVLAGIRLAANPKDAVSRDRLKKLSKTKLHQFEELLGEKPETASSPLQTAQAFLRAFRYEDYLEKSFDNDIERKENVAELLRAAGEHETMAGFLQNAALMQSVDRPSSVGRRRSGRTDGREADVVLMTIHMAKGLEFENVFVAGCSEGLLPHERSIPDPRALEEERRLMYVAMTRAKKRLTLVFYGIPSRFLYEIPQEHTAFEGGGVERELVDDEERYITLD